MQNRFNRSEIEFIQKIAEQGLKTQTYYDTFRTELKVHKICTKLRVNSIEEVIRKVLFYKWFDLNITDEYRNYVFNKAREYITTTQVVRNQMLEFAKNVPQAFGNLCTHSVCLNDEELKYRANEFIETVKSDIETYRLFNSVKCFKDLISKQYNFKMIFDNIFLIADEEIEDINKAEQLLQSSSARYLMTVRLCMEKAFPIKLKRELTAEEKDIVKFLRYKGDEIDYIEQCSLPIESFEEKLDAILQAYNVMDIQELLISNDIEESFSISSLVYESFFLNVRANTIQNSKNKYLLKLNNNKKKQLAGYFEELEKYTIPDFLTTSNMQKHGDIWNKLNDSDFITIGKTDEFNHWYCDNIQNLYSIKKTKELLDKIEQVSL